MDFTIRSDVDRKGAQRTVPMRYLVLAMPRTGTNSLRDALRLLGYNECYHQATLVQNPKDGIMWLEALETQGTDRAFTRREWDALLGHCQAVSDIPAMHFWKELVDAYSEAKVILSTRDVDAWHHSVSQTIETRYRSRFVYFLSLFDRYTSLWADVMYRGWGEMFQGDFDKHGRDVFKAHEDAVRQYCQSNRLLEYHVGQGWSPLCKFLGEQVPDEPFPSGNGQGEFHEACRALDRSRLKVVLLKTTTAFLGVAAAVAVARRWQLNRLIRI